MTVVAYNTKSDKTPGGASKKSVGYLRVLWGERTDKPFPYENFNTRPQEDISATIKSVLKRAALPTSEAQLDTLAKLANELNLHVDAKDTRDAANRQIRDLQIRASRQRRARAEAHADAELDDLFGGDDTATEPTEDDDLPF